MLPPGLASTWQDPSDANQIRQRCRQTLGVSQNEIVLLSVGSHFKTKGIARSLHAYAALPIALQLTTRLMVIGKGEPKRYLQLAKQLNIASRVTFLGAKHDVLPFMLAADLLLHPARYESAGLVLLEALAVGLPVITTQDCGHAWHIARANAGVVLPSPFSQATYNSVLHTALVKSTLTQWQQNGLTYVKHTNLHGLHERAVDIIEMVGDN